MALSRFSLFYAVRQIDQHNNELKSLKITNSENLPNDTYTCVFTEKHARKDYMGRAMRKVSSGICGQQRPRSACASAQSDQGLHCRLTESLDTIDTIESLDTIDTTESLDNIELLNGGQMFR